jgi:hypothetical protein
MFGFAPQRAGAGSPQRINGSWRLHKFRQNRAEIGKICFRQSQSIEWTRKQLSQTIDRRMHIMPSERPSRFKWSIISVTLLALAAFGKSAQAQEATEPAAPNAAYVDDWTHHHLVFSNPGTREDAVKSGKLEKWQEITNEPRYQLQQAKRTFGTRPVVADPDLGFGPGGSWDRNPIPRGARPPLRIFGDGVKKDWSTNLGSGTTGSVTAPIATLTSTPTPNISGSSTLTIDNVTFDASPPTSSTGSVAVAPAYCLATGQGVTINGVNLTTTATASKGTITISTDPGSGDTITTGSGAASTNPGTVTYVWHGSTGNCGGIADCVVHTGTTSTDAQDLSSAIGGSCAGTACAPNPYVTATYSSNTVTITSRCGGATAVTETNNSTPGRISFAATPVGSNGTTGGANFAIGASNTATATNIASAITTNQATDGVTANAPSGTITLTGTTQGSSSTLTATLDGSSTGITILGVTGGTNGTTSGTNSPPTFAYWSGSTYVSSLTLATNIATAVDTNATTGNVILASGGSGGVTFSHYEPGTYTVTPAAFSAFNGGTSVTIPAGTTATVQPNAYPAKWGASLTTASCAGDFVVYPTGQAGATGAANIIAYNELYSGCAPAPVPSVYWAYNTENSGTGYTVTTSPIISVNGTEVAFIQSNGTSSDLVVLKWKASNGTLAGPVAPGLANNITTCPAPCMTVTALNHNDTYSSPFYDFNGADDTIYVGDDNGYLEKFTGVFNGTANPTGTEVSLNTGPYAITSPVYDGVSGCVFVGDTEGYLYSVSSGVAGTVCKGTTFALYGQSEDLGGGGANEGIFDGPLVDPVAQTVYVFVADSGAISPSVTLNAQCTLNGETVTCTYVVTAGILGPANIGQELYYDGFPSGTIATVNANGLGGTWNVSFGPGLLCFGNGVCNGDIITLPANVSAGENAVDEFTTNSIGSGNTAPAQTQPLGTGGASYGIYSGSFDNAYFSSPSNTGNLYAVGNTGTTTGATLFQIPITNGSIAGVNSAVTALTPNAASAYPWPSPATEFYDNGADYLFFSVNRGNKTGCNNAAGNGCILSYNITTTTPALSGTGLNVTAPGTNGCWATGGLVIDNSATGTTGAQQIYFVNLNGAEAGGAGGAPPTSSYCTAGTGPTIQAVQASQSGTP